MSTTNASPCLDIEYSTLSASPPRTFVVASTHLATISSRCFTSSSHTCVRRSVSTCFGSGAVDCPSSTAITL